MPKLQKGFTLIELIMVIVILGILAAVALPRFYDLQTDARKAKADAIFGAVRSASAIVHSAALVNNATTATGTVTLEGAEINLVYGYPAATVAEATSGGIVLAANLGATSDGLAISLAGTTVTIEIKGGTATTCTVTYAQATSTGTPAVISAPTISSVKTGC